LSEQERRQTAHVGRRESVAAVWFSQNALDHERIDVHRADMEQMQAEHRDLLVIDPVAGNLASTGTWINVVSKTASLSS
jgi:hypothetical protein